MAHERILIVEDETITGIEIRDHIEELGYEPLGPVAYAEEAVARILDFCPDVILMDITLKGDMDGVQAATEISSSYSCPIIYLTAHSDQVTLDRAKVTEPYGYIVKPINERELHIAIDIALYKHRMERRLKESKEWFESTLKSIDEAIVALDTQGLVTYLNPAAENFLGWPQAEALGKSALEVFNVIGEEPLSAMGVDPGKRDKQVSVCKKDGKVVTIIYRAAPIVSGTEEIVGVVIIFREGRLDQSFFSQDDDGSSKYSEAGEAWR